RVGLSALSPSRQAPRQTECYRPAARGLRDQCGRAPLVAFPHVTRTNPKPTDRRFANQCAEASWHCLGTTCRPLLSQVSLLAPALRARDSRVRARPGLRRLAARSALVAQIDCLYERSLLAPARSFLHCKSFLGGVASEECQPKHLC